MLEEVIEYLNLKPGQCILDATCGGGGHTEEIAKRILPGGKLIAVDKDLEAIERVKGKLKEYKDNIVFVNSDFKEISKILKEADEAFLDGAVFDLGFSSFQLEDSGRGLSFLKDGFLDMRFDKNIQITAFNVINEASREELADIIYKYGEERYSRLIANAIYDCRKNKKISTTLELVDIIESSVGRKYRNQRIHSACRTFQALRIFVNDELGSLEEALNSVISKLKVGGRLCFISFHSLEDRIVKEHFKKYKMTGEIKILTKKIITPSREEVRENSRARSAKLRVAEKIL